MTQCAETEAKSQKMQREFGDALEHLNNLAINPDFSDLCTHYALPCSLEEFVAELSGAVSFEPGRAISDMTAEEQGAMFESGPFRMALCEAVAGEDTHT